MRVGLLGRWVVLALVAGGSGPALALLLEARLQSAIGQPLRAIVPTVGLSDEALDVGCFRVFRPGSMDGIAFPTDARLEVEELSSGKRLVIRSRSPIQDPVIRVGVEWVCGPSIRREYTLLLDPVAPVEATVAPVAPSVVAAPIAASFAQAPSPSGEANARAMAESGQSPPVRNPRSRVPLDDGTQVLALRRPNAAIRDRLAIRGAPEGLARHLDRTVLLSPRLRLSPTIALGGLDRPLTEVDRAVIASKRDRLISTPIESDLRPQLEVDLMIAQKRIAELQARLGAAGLSAKAASEKSAASTVSAAAPGRSAVPTASPAAIPATPSSVQPTPAAASPDAAASGTNLARETAKPRGESFASWFVRWVWLPALLGVLALSGALFWMRKKRQQEEQERAYAAAAAAVGLTPDLGSEQSGGGYVNTGVDYIDSIILEQGPQSVRPPRNVGKDDDSSRTPKKDPTHTVTALHGTPMGLTTVKGGGSGLDITAEHFHPNFDTAQLGVSMVSAVTEEASVYVELGRIQEAIAVLTEHIDLERAYNRATPAPWLILLDLYHSTNNRVDFEALRGEFMKNFNGRIPEWGSFDDVTSHKPLMDHEHIVERLVKYWGTPKCRAYIQKLLYDHRNNSRIGFSLTAYRELVLLDFIHQLAFPTADQAAASIPEP